MPVHACAAPCLCAPGVEVGCQAGPDGWSGGGWISTALGRWASSGYGAIAPLSTRCDAGARGSSIAFEWCELGAMMAPRARRGGRRLELYSAEVGVRVGAGAGGDRTSSARTAVVSTPQLPRRAVAWPCQSA